MYLSSHHPQAKKHTAKWIRVRLAKVMKWIQLRVLVELSKRYDGYASARQAYALSGVYKRHGKYVCTISKHHNGAPPIQSAGFDTRGTAIGAQILANLAVASSKYQIAHFAKQKGNLYCVTKDVASNKTMAVCKMVSSLEEVSTVLYCVSCELSTMTVREREELRDANDYWEELFGLVIGFINDNTDYTIYLKRS
jgi:hypothetical protein